jgi:PTH2 family peptidyl-tRNA hydrolase
MALILRSDLSMGKGKLCSQAAHAALLASRAAGARRGEGGREALAQWHATGSAKIVLRCSSEEELLSLAEAGSQLGMVSVLVSDAGRTQVEPGSMTACALGPAPQSLLDKVTGSLKLL